MSECNKPPRGWRCTRKVGHDGPCAAVEDHVYRGVKYVVIPVVLMWAAIIGAVVWAAG